MKVLLSALVSALSTALYLVWDSQQSGKQTAEPRKTKCIEWINASSTVIIAAATLVSALYIGRQFYDSSAANRPHLSVSNVIVGYPIDSDKTVAVNFKNFGHTPAFVEEIPATCSYFKTLPPPVPKGKGTEITDFHSGLKVLKENDELGEITRNINATRDEFEKARHGVGTVRCLFAVIYSDVNAVVHTAGLCLSYVYVDGQGGFIACRESQYHYEQ